MPDRIRERWKDLENELTSYYSTPGRLAVFRRQFEKARRRPGLHPATFTTELGILALHGFTDMKEKACDLMVRNKFASLSGWCCTGGENWGQYGQLPRLGVMRSR